MDPSVSVDCISQVASGWFPLLPLDPGPPDRPVNAAVEADDDRQGKKTQENQPAGKPSLVRTVRGEPFNNNQKG